MNKKKKILFGCGIFLLMMFISGFIIALSARSSGSKYIDAIKKTAYSKVKTLSEDKAWISNYTDKHKKTEGKSGSKDSPDTLIDGLITMDNGDWITYYYRTSKQDSFPRKLSCILAGKCPYDIFIGKASDNKWYTTNYHFCINMLVLKINGQSPDLKAFSKNIC